MSFANKSVRPIVLSFVFLISISATAGGKFGGSRNFPIGPDPILTPGSLCEHPTKHRYPEQIAYCDRAVATSLKKQIIHIYDEQLGFSVESMDRQQFKIDHYIPLCAGGSNEADNLWPQHQSVYDITDPMEPLICEKMAAGHLAQMHAVELIKLGKNHLEKVPEIMRELESL